MNGVVKPGIAPVSDGAALSDECELDRILAEKDLSPVYQPIVSVREQQIFGYEALVRGPADSPLFTPPVLFGAAAKQQRLGELEILCREVCVSGAGRLGLSAMLFLNTLPESVVDPAFPHAALYDAVLAAGLDPRQLVIEVTEHHPVDDYDLMREAIGRYRDMGFNIAIDDLGAGYAGLRQWSELRPDYVKIDRHFVSDVHIDAAKRQFVHSICEISHILGCKVVAEGIEQQEEYEVLRSLGVHYAQGYLFARPQPNPPRSLPRATLSRMPQVSFCRHCTQTVGTLVRDHAVVPSATQVEDVVDMFRDNEQIRCVPVVDGGMPVGMVRRDELLNLYASRFGRELHGRKPIREFMEDDFLVVASDTLVEQLSQRVTEATESLIGNDFIVVNETGYYIGTGTLVDLLRVITELQMRNARYANPLTQLPGNVPISEHMDQLLGSHEDFVVVYADLDNFKPFNDAYGYARGDDAIRGLARILSQHVNPKQDFIGHVGGDDFILILRSRDWKERCEAVLQKFEQFAPRLYDPVDRKRGGIEALDRQGKPQFFPYLSISLAAVPASLERYLSHHEISALASELKSQAKRINGNVLFVDRRSNGTENLA